MTDRRKKHYSDATIYPFRFGKQSESAFRSQRDGNKVVHVDDQRAGGRPAPLTTSENGRGERIRTSDPCLPK
ncbi:MAG: hypothetical protein OSA92_12935, partial [Pirellulaceae bacterium]|nr:hypothetical protein [Pirellulaceae bacterium]